MIGLGTLKHVSPISIDKLYVIPEDWRRIEKALEEHGSVGGFVTEGDREDWRQNIGFD